MEHEQFIDGRIQGLTVSSEGEIFLTKQMQGDDSIIYRSVFLNLHFCIEFFIVCCERQEKKYNFHVFLYFDLGNWFFKLLTVKELFFWMYFLLLRCRSLALVDVEQQLTNLILRMYLYCYIFRTSLDCPLGWEEVICEDEFAFQTLSVYDSNTLVVATCSIPVNMYSK